MKELLKKELEFTSLKLTYFFILFGLMTFIPGYPILLGAFFVSLGIFQTFEDARLQNDVLFTVLLPIKKKDVVSARYLYVIIVEALFFALCAIITAIRMTIMRNSQVYLANVMMNANLSYLGYILIILGLFNTIFLKGFFKTGYYVGKPFLWYGAASFLVVAVAETIHHFPGFKMLNSPTEGLNAQAAILLSGTIFYILSTLFSWKKSLSDFELLDL